ncbi:MAG: OmpH family outer membrane protein [Bacteroidota bacterium]|nr:OmpH family outer membrane protein [Ferruginibacter sp.]
MKQFSIVLNIVLLIAVAALYYLHFKGSKKELVKGGTVNPATMDTSTAKRLIVAYVELDSLNNNVTFIKQRKKELESEQKVIANEYESAYRSLTAERDKFLQRGNAITQQEAEEFQARLGQKQQEVEQNKQAKGQRLAEKGARIMEDMQTKLKTFMNEYNKDKRYTYILATGTGLDYLFYKDSTLNITGDVIKGLNEQMKDSPKQ